LQSWRFLNAEEVKTAFGVKAEELKGRDGAKPTIRSTYTCGSTRGGERGGEGGGSVHFYSDVGRMSAEGDREGEGGSRSGKKVYGTSKKTTKFEEKRDLRRENRLEAHCKEERKRPAAKRKEKNLSKNGPDPLGSR